MTEDCGQWHGPLSRERWEMIEEALAFPDDEAVEATWLLMEHGSMVSAIWKTAEFLGLPTAPTVREHMGATAIAIRYMLIQHPALRGVLPAGLLDELGITQPSRDEERYSA